MYNIKPYIENNRVIIPILEIHAAHNCNLKCQSCSHYSNNSSGKNLEPDALIRSLTEWRQKILPKTIKILGGEPFLNNNLEEILRVCRTNFPHSKIDLSSNGLILTKIKFNFKCLIELNISLLISIHSEESEYRQQMQDTFNLLNELNIPFRQIESYKRWRRTHHVVEGILTPFMDNNSRQSWDICISKNYRQLLDGNIYKCPQVAYINKVKIPTHKNFDMMKQYMPITPEASLQQILEFFSKEEEDICSLCPAKTEYFKKEIN